MAEIFAPPESSEINDRHIVTSSPGTVPTKRPLDVILDPASTVEATPSGLTIGGKVTIVPLNSATWTPLPATILTSRNGMGFQNDSGIDVKINFDSGVVGYVGWTVKAGGEFFIDVGSIVVYAKSASGTPSVTVMEVA